MSGVKQDGIAKARMSLQVLHGIDLEIQGNMSVGPSDCSKSEASRRRMATLSVLDPRSALRPVFSILDGQGHDCGRCFKDTRNNSFKVEVPRTHDVGAN